MKGLPKLSLCIDVITVSSYHFRSLSLIQQSTKSTQQLLGRLKIAFNNCIGRHTALKGGKKAFHNMHFFLKFKVYPLLFTQKSTLIAYTGKKKIYLCHDYIIEYLQICFQ